MNTFVPGPWQYNKAGPDGYEIYAWIDKRPLEVAFVQTVPVNLKWKADANAALIAAAPALLKACRDAVEALDKAPATPYISGLNVNAMRDAVALSERGVQRP